MATDILRGTKRKPYSSAKVRKMRSERLLTRAKKDGISNEAVQHYLGKLQAAGHMKINGMVSFDVTNEKTLNLLSENYVKTTTIKFSSHVEKGMGERPHMVGYLQSASDNDKQYKLKGWFNEDGTFRIELVN